jgi:hypothetical protein
MCSECGSEMSEGMCSECGYTNEGMCSECGSEMSEGMCSECGAMESEMTEKLHGKQYKIDKNKNGRIDSEDFKMLRRKSEVKEKLYGNQHRIDKNKNNKIDAEDFRMLRKEGRMSNVEKQLYSIVIDNQRFVFNESEMIDVIENIVLEEKKKKKSKTKKTDVIKQTKSNIEKSGKENDEYLNSVVKKMKEYLKDGSKGEYEMNPKHFPRGNGEIEKMDKMAYIPSNAVQDYTDNFTAASLENLDFNDGIQPNEEWMDDLLVGASRTGNNPEWANAVETPANKKRNKIRKDNLLSKLKRKAYNKSAQPVVNDKSGNETDKASKMMMKLESKSNREVMSDIENMKKLITYNQKTQ